MILQPSEAQGEQLHPSSSNFRKKVCVFLCHFHVHQAKGLKSSCHLIFVAMVTRVPVELVVHRKCTSIFLTGEEASWPASGSGPGMGT